MDVLLVDSEPSILDVTRSVLAGRADRLSVASNVSEAVAMLEGGSIDVLICDPTSQDMCGHDVLGRSLRCAPEAFRMAVSAVTSAARLVRALNECRFHYCLCQPVTASDLTAAMARAAEHLAQIKLRREQSESGVQWTQFLENRVLQQTDGVAHAVEDTLCALMTALDIRENESAHHSRRVALCSLLLAILLEVDMDQLENIYFGALLHDVGKIGVRDEVLLKPARLTTDERRHIESHIEIGVRLLSDVKRFRSVLDIPQYHHERVDGTGYPAGKVRDEIPLSARLFAIVDVYDALRHERPYKGALDHERAQALLNEERGTHFHEDLLDCFCAIPESVWNQLAEAAPEVRSFTDALLACHRARPQHLTGTWPALCRA